MSLTELATAIDAKLIGAETAFDGVSTDSRALRAGQLFIALREITSLRWHWDTVAFHPPAKSPH